MISVLVLLGVASLVLLTVAYDHSMAYLRALETIRVLTASIGGAGQAATGRGPAGAETPSPARKAVRAKRFTMMMVAARKAEEEGVTPDELPPSGDAAEELRKLRKHMRRHACSTGLCYLAAAVHLGIAGCEVDLTYFLDNIDFLYFHTPTTYFALCLASKLVDLIAVGQLIVHSTYTYSHRHFFNRLRTLNPLRRGRRVLWTPMPLGNRGSVPPGSAVWPVEVFKGRRWRQARLVLTLPPEEPGVGASAAGHKAGADAAMLATAAGYATRALGGWDGRILLKVQLQGLEAVYDLPRARISRPPADKRATTRPTVLRITGRPPPTVPVALLHSPLLQAANAITHAANAAVDAMTHHHHHHHHHHQQQQQGSPIEPESQKQPRLLLPRSGQQQCSLMGHIAEESHETLGHTTTVTSLPPSRQASGTEANASPAREDSETVQELGGGGACTATADVGGSGQYVARTSTEPSTPTRMTSSRLASCPSCPKISRAARHAATRSAAASAWCRSPPSRLVEGRAPRRH